LKHGVKAAVVAVLVVASGVKLVVKVVIIL
jgi:hypothetical protein